MTQGLVRPRTLRVAGCCAILIAILIGPTIVIVPDAIASAGIVPSLVILVLLWLLGSLCASMLCEALAAVPNNEHYLGQVEFVAAVHYYLGPKQYQLAVNAFNLGFLLTIVLSIVQSANVCDAMIASVFGTTCGLKLNPPGIGVVCHHSRHALIPDVDYCRRFRHNRTQCLGDEALGCNWGYPSDFGITPKTPKSKNNPKKTNTKDDNGGGGGGEGSGEEQQDEGIPPAEMHVEGCFPDSRTLWGRGVSFVLTFGVLIVAIVCLPLAMGNLESNVMVQVISVVGTVFIFALWLIAMFFRAEHFPASHRTIPTELTWFGSGAGVASLIGTVLYSSGFAHYMPSLLNEAKLNLSVNKVIWYSSTFALIVTIVLGFGGAMVFGHNFVANTQADLLEAVTYSRQTPQPYLSWARGGVYLFPFLVLIPGIPVACIMLKYNLQEEGPMFTPQVATFWAVVFPFLFSLPFLSYTSALNTAVAWLSVVVLSWVDILIPLRLFLAYAQWKEHSALEDEHLAVSTRDTFVKGIFSESPFAAVELTLSTPPSEDQLAEQQEAKRRRPGLFKRTVADRGGSGTPPPPSYGATDDISPASGEQRTEGDERESAGEGGESGGIKPDPQQRVDHRRRVSWRDEDLDESVAPQQSSDDSIPRQRRRVMMESPARPEPSSPTTERTTLIVARHKCPETEPTHVAIPRGWLPLSKAPAVCRVMMICFLCLMVVTIASMLQEAWSEVPAGAKTAVKGAVEEVEHKYRAFERPNYDRTHHQGHQEGNKRKEH